MPIARTEPRNAQALTDGELRRCMQNRELSWLQFNERVLEEAASVENPLFERFFFLSIFSSNLDEFFMIRVGTLCDHVQNKTGAIDNKTGMSAAEQLALIYAAAIPLYAGRDAVYKGLEAELAARAGIERLNPKNYAGEKKNKRLLDSYFENQLEPLLSPQIVDQSHPFPHFENKRQIIALSLETKGGKPVFGMIPVPHGMERTYGVERAYYPSGGGYMLIEDVILHYSEKLFKKYKVVEKAIVCVTRNADIVAEEERYDEDEDFRDHMRKLLKKRKRLSPVRLEVRGGHCAKLVAYLQKKLSLDPSQTFFSAAPLDMSYCAALRDIVPRQERQEFAYPPFEPAISQAASLPGGMLGRVRLGDFLLSLPFESIQPFMSLVREAAEDKQVLSIQITLYRIAEQSKLVEALILAAENGKEVYVFIELRARMDEENNIGLARRLEEAGCNVFYGPAGYKLHAKICLITRREGIKNEYVTHIGTGNYNEKTARLYTDISIMTANEAIGRDAAHFFSNLMIGAHDDVQAYALLRTAPQRFKPELIELINREAQNGDGGRITIKCNSLTDRDVIIALIDASRAGVSIDLIIRGICCLIAQIPGLTQNIRVRSIVGRFLEHSRVYCFGTGDDCVMYIGSGDMMTRNTERRIELFTPVLDTKIKRRLSAMLDIMLRDNVKAREMGADGQYSPVSRRNPLSAYGIDGAGGGAADGAASIDADAAAAAEDGGASDGGAYAGGAYDGGAIVRASFGAHYAGGAGTRFDSDMPGGVGAGGDAGGDAGVEPLDSQMYFVREAIENAMPEAEPIPERHGLFTGAVKNIKKRLRALFIRTKRQ